MKKILKYGELDLDRGHCSRCIEASSNIDNATSSNIPMIAYGLRFDHGHAR